MTSEKVIAANRHNARRSTGPSTAAGKRKSGGNAIRHGLTASIHADPQMGARMAQMVAALAGPGASPRLSALVEPIAEAEIDILRARNARAGLINLAAAEGASPAQSEADAVLKSLPSLVRLERYERRAMARRSRAMRALRREVHLYGII